MTHLELENLASEYLEGGLDAARHGQVEEHLAGCELCQGLLSDIRLAIQVCQSANEVTPPPWLVPRIRRATTGEVQAGVAEQVRAFLHSVRQPRFVYAVGMAVFSISLIANIAGFNARSLTAQDLNPSTWFYRANRAGHMAYARAEKFYDDLRIVYEIESRFRNAQATPPDGKKASEPNPPSERPASTAGSWNQQLAYAGDNAAGQHIQLEQGAQSHEMR